MPWPIHELADVLQGELRGDPATPIDEVAPLDEAGPRSISFVTNGRQAPERNGEPIGALIVGEADAQAASQWARAVVVVADVMQAVARLLEYAYPQRPRPSVGVSPAAFVAESAVIGAGTNVFPGAYVGYDVVLGENCDIYPGVYIGPGCRIGDRVVLHPNVVLYPDVEIGNDVTIHAGAVIGADGFGHRIENGRFVTLPHVGGCRIEDDVEIGACTTIDRGMLKPTVIGTGSRIDNQVMIAHNCRIGRHNVFASQVGLAGSVTTGDRVIAGGQVGVRDHIHLGEGCVLGAKAGVHKDVPAGEVFLGIPARPLEEQRRIVMATTRLPELRQRLRELERRLEKYEALCEQLASERTDAPPVQPRRRASA